LNKAIFLDKDGTLIKDVPYNVDPNKVVLEAYAIEALNVFQNKGYKLIIVSNQPGIALSLFDIVSLDKLRRYIWNLLFENNINLNAFYYCPHYVSGNNPIYSIACNCHKPMPGMLLQAAIDHQIDLAQSWMIGDILNDVEAGARAGCKTIHIDNGNETEWLEGAFRVPTFTVGNLKEAAQVIDSN